MGKDFKDTLCPKCFSGVHADSSFCRRCGSPLREESETYSYPEDRDSVIGEVYYAPGDKLGERYQIIEEIGRGGMGRVYKARDLELDTVVALKIIRPDFASKPRFIKQFKRETLLGRAISHENVIRIFDIGETEGIKYITMEFVRGESLKELIWTSGSLTVETVIYFARQICSALGAAHKKKIVHKDLKPSNIMVDRNGGIHIMDFGLAQLMDRERGGIQRKIMGTPPYLSPEQAQGLPLDQRSDIYNVGCILYEMITGQQPFKADSTEEYIQKHLYERAPSPLKAKPGIPFILEKIVLKCLEKNPEDRYQSCEEICRELETEKEKIVPLPMRLWRVKGFRIPALVLLFCFILAGIYLVIKNSGPGIPPPTPQEKRSVAVMLFENNTGDENLDYLRKTITYLINWDLIQSRYLNVLGEERLFDILRELQLEDAAVYSASDLKNVAYRAGVYYVLSGNFTQLGDEFRINVKLHDTISGGKAATHMVKSEGLDYLHDMVDEITPWLKLQFNLTNMEIAQDLDRDLKDITTDSPQSLMYYMDGLQLYHERKWKESIESFELAVRFDPEFAMAYRMMATCYAYLGENQDKVEKFLLAALENLDHVSERENFLIRGAYSNMVEKSYLKTIEIYREFLDQYPEDGEFNILLGSVYRNLEEWEQAEVSFEKVARSGLKYPSAYQNLSYIYMAEGEYEKAREILAANLDVFPNKAFIHYLYGHIYLCQARYDLSLVEIDTALSLSPLNHQYRLFRGWIYYLSDDFESAENVFKNLAQNDSRESRLLGQNWLCRLSLTLGQYGKSMNEAALGLKHAQEFGSKNMEMSFYIFMAYLNLKTKNFREALNMSNKAYSTAARSDSPDYLKKALVFRGLSEIHLDRKKDAGETVRQLGELVQNTAVNKHNRYVHFLSGMLAFSEEDVSGSIEFFESANSLLTFQIYTLQDPSFFLEPLARAYFKSGDLEKAKAVYEKIVSLTTSRLEWGDIYSASHYWLGKICQKLGWTGKAIEYYETFVKLWEKADSGKEELDDAKNELMNLKAGGASKIDLQ